MLKYIQAFRIAEPDRDLRLRRFRPLELLSVDYCHDWSGHVSPIGGDGTALLELSEDYSVARWKELAYFTCSPIHDAAAHAVEPLIDLLEELSVALHGPSPGMVSTARAFVDILVQADDLSVDERSHQWEIILSVLEGSKLPEDALGTVLLRMMASDDEIGSDLIIRALRIFPTTHKTVRVKAKAAAVAFGRQYENDSTLVTILEEIFESEFVSDSIAAEAWIALTLGSVPAHVRLGLLERYLDRLRWPDRKYSLAGRPDLLRRLSQLEDEYLM